MGAQAQHEKRRTERCLLNCKTSSKAASTSETAAAMISVKLWIVRGCSFAPPHCIIAATQHSATISAHALARPYPQVLDYRTHLDFHRPFWPVIGMSVPLESGKLSAVAWLCTTPRYSSMAIAHRPRGHLDGPRRYRRLRLPDQIAHRPRRRW